MGFWGVNCQITIRRLLAIVMIGAIIAHVTVIGPSAVPAFVLLVLTATIWLADIKNFAEMNSVWDMWVPKGNTPCRACVESKLANPQYKVEIRVIAAK